MPKWSIITLLNRRRSCLRRRKCVRFRLSSKAPAKRLQHANATYCNIVGPNMLCAFGHTVATCYDMLGVVGSNLTIFKLEPTAPNMSQRIGTRWPNARNMLRPTMLRYVVLACCDRLAGALGISINYRQNDKGSEASFPWSVWTRKTISIINSHDSKKS